MDVAAFAHGVSPRLLTRWLPLAIGLAALYGPTFVDLSRTIWQSEEHAHAPLVLAITAWLLWQQRGTLLASIGNRATGVGPWVLLAIGCLLYVVGRSQSIILFELGSVIPILAGTIAALCGWGAVRATAFPLLFLVFMLPVPGPLAEALTVPLKHSVSWIAEVVLYGLGYPIARSGVVLSIGQYQLLVADACSGLNSMFSLSALGILYLHLVRHPALWRNALIVLSIVPIAFASNIIRVMILVLVTYHFGDASGQGMIHGAAGMVLFVIALLLFFALDGLLGMFDKRENERV